MLKGPLTLRNTVETCATLRKALAQHAAVAIDCGGATDIGLSFIQLLVAARSGAQQASGIVKLAACPNGALHAVLACAGLRSANLAPPGAIDDFWFEGAPAGKILTVDDSARVRQMIKLTWSGAGY